MVKADEKPAKGKKARLLKFAVSVLIVYVAYLLVQQQFDIKDRRADLADLERRVQEQELSNLEIQRLLAGGNDEYVERIAKSEFGYAYPDETVYVDVSGS